tara:strand:- start:1741 stop:2211 length:471 start_codon:yes stop_codon:yes gene_type:complete
MSLNTLKHITVFFSIVFFSCNKITHEEYYSFPQSGWFSDSIVTFQYCVLDTIKTYDISLKIRHAVDYEFQNLFVFLESTKKDTIEIILANKKGKWLGKGLSNLRELEHVLEIDRRFLRSGEHSLKVEQAMRYGGAERIENLKHILDIGLIISENNE